MNFAERLQTADSVEEFEALKDELWCRNDEYIFENIRSLVVLRACLRYLQPSDDRLTKIFYHVASQHRIDLMQLFFDELFTFDFLTNTKDKMEVFRDFVCDTVIALGYVDVLKFFLEKGLEIDTPIGSTTDLMCYAIYYKKVDIIDLLFSEGTDVNAVDSQGRTPVFLAARTTEIRILDRFIMHGADFFHRNVNGENLWSAAIFNFYDEELDINFQRIADMGVPLDEAVYKETCRCLRPFPRIKGLVAIMHEVAKKQGFEVLETGK